jgi:hypothetical protein
VLVLIAYVAFELHVLQRSKHRTEPLFIHDRYIEARQATARCGDPDAEQRADFERNLGAVSRRARADLAEQNPGLGEADVERLLDERAAEVAATVNVLVDEKGCEDIEVWKLVKRHELRARQNLR